jgi:hypothetical protein
MRYNEQKTCSYQHEPAEWLQLILKSVHVRPEIIALLTKECISGCIQIGVYKAWDWLTNECTYFRVHLSDTFASVYKGQDVHSTSTRCSLSCVKRVMTYTITNKQRRHGWVNSNPDSQLANVRFIFRVRRPAIVTRYLDILFRIRSTQLLFNSFPTNLKKGSYFECSSKKRTVRTSLPSHERWYSNASLGRRTELITPRRFALRYSFIKTEFMNVHI